MGNAFTGIGTMSQALRIFQRGLDVTGHNIANVNTVGYSRQRMLLQNTPGNLEWGMQGGYVVGNGVSLANVVRMRSSYLDTQYRDSNSEMARNGSLMNAVGQIAKVFPEPASGGVSDALQKFFDAWSALSANPSDAAAKLQVQQVGQTLTQRVRSTYSTVNNASAGFATELTSSFNRVDELTASIADLNQEITAKVATGAEPGDLLDRRDLLIDELSGYMDLTVCAEESGAVRIYSGEIRLVDSNASFAIPRTYNSTNLTLSDGTNTYAIGSGSILGTLQSIGTAQSVLTQLDSLANQLRTQVNTVHQTGTNSLGTTGISFFNDSVPQTGAADFNLSAEVIANVNNISSGVSGNAGDGGLALALSQMRDTKITALGDKTFKTYYADMLSSVGSQVALHTSAYDTQEAVMAQIDNQRSQASGVNLDEEMTSLLRYQRSYQAASKALSVMDQVTEELVNLIR